MAAEMLSCPKHMEYGPCGGVESDGTCEVADHPCPYVTRPVQRWHGVVSPVDAPVFPAPLAVNERGRRMLDLMAKRPVVISDFPIRAPRREAVEAAANVFAGRVDAVLIGEPPSVGVQLPPAYRTALLRRAGVEVWSSVNCRDRNRVALEGELAALADAGVTGVHCITGDHNRLGRRPEAMPVFDLDSTQLTALARSFGLLVSVAETPDAPPREKRPARFREKVVAGASVCFVNISEGPETIRRFARAADELGAASRFIPCVPFLIDEGSARIMTGLSSHALPPGYVDRIMGSASPREEGIRAAIELSEEFLAVDGVAGVCISGGAARGRELEYAEAMAEMSDRLGVRG